MLSTVRSLKNIVFRKLGHCARCMKASFAMAIAAWTLFIVVLATGPAVIARAVELAAIALGALWFAHIVVFAWRATPSARVSREAERCSRQVFSLSRRALLPIFLRTLAFAAVVTASPRAITSAFAENQGPCDHCSRFRGSSACWTCCSCQNSNCITGCKKTSGGDPNKYNTCIGNCSTTFGNCNKECQ